MKSVIFLALIATLSGAPDLPDHTLTPGAINTAVTQDTIAKTICVSGYTTTIRPKVEYTNTLKAEQLRNPRYPSQNMALYEEDHLIPLELGGNPTDPKNLWPEHWNGAWGAHKKDRLENRLHRLVCPLKKRDKRITLKTAQDAISGDWIMAYRMYVK
jgi:hypothetical protein